MSSIPLISDLCSAIETHQQYCWPAGQATTDQGIKLIFFLTARVQLSLIEEGIYLSLLSISSGTNINDAGSQPRRKSWNCSVLSMQEIPTLNLMQLGFATHIRKLFTSAFSQWPFLKSHLYTWLDWFRAKSNIHCPSFYFHMHGKYSGHK